MAADERVICCPKSLLRKSYDKEKSILFIVLSILFFISGCVHGQAYTRSSPQPSATLAAIALSIKSRPIQDSRCYLMNGGAVESFFISEDTPVGSVIGTLSVNGDPREEDGNISLRIQEKGAAIGLAPGTKNVTLLRPLDREEKNGPSNIYVNVRCDRRRTTDPSFIIPVSVRVWDVNDNPPVWERGEYKVKVSELAAVGTRLVNVKAEDKDQPGPHNTIHYYVLPGPYSDHFGFANELDSVLVLKKPLDYETIHNVTVKLRAEDSGTPPLHADATLHVQVMDADDHNPKFTYDRYMAVLPEDAVEGAELQVTPGPISAQDQDVGINAPLYYTIQDDRRLLILHNDTGRVGTTADLLRASLPITFVIKATQYDNPDRYALSTLTINRVKPRSGIKFLSRIYSGAVREDTPTGSVILKLHTDRDGDNPSLQFYVSDRSFLDKFAINSAGEVILRRPLDYEETDQYHYQVMVTDGNSNDTATLNMSIVNVNEWEPRFRHLQYEFKVTNTGDVGGLVDVGKVEVYDGDKGDHVTLGLQGPDANLFYINDMGEIYMKEEALSALNTSVVHVTATAQDSGVPMKQSSVPVLVHVPSARPIESSRVAASGTVVVVFGVALLTLAGLVVGLIGYIFRYKRSKTSPSKPPPTLNEKMSAPVDVEGRSGSLLSVSAGASTILASTSSLQIPDAVNETPNARPHRYSKTKIAPQPPEIAPHAGNGVMSDHIHGGPGRSGVAWPSATIPARVKKLSWDDNDKNKGSSGESNLDIHEASNPALTDHMNLTVYF